MRSQRKSCAPSADSDSRVEHPSLARTLKELQAVGKAISLTDAVRRSQADGAREHITVETVFTDHGNPLDLVDLDRPGCHILGEKDCRGIWINEDGREWFVGIWPSHYSNVYYIASTINPTDRRWRRVVRWFNRDSGIVRPFLNHDDFEQIGSSLSEFGDVEVGRVSARSAIDGSSDTRGWKALIGQLRPSYAEVISAMEAQGYSVRTMMLHIHGMLSVHVRRLAGATYHSGDFLLFADRVLDPLARAASERRHLLAGRQRARHREVRPVSIILASPRIIDHETTGEIIREVAMLPHTTLAVFHRNPYLHFAVTDETDGSNFDVMVTESRTIDVYPGYRVTTAGLARIVDHISDRFGGDRINDRAERSYTLDELTVGR